MGTAMQDIPVTASFSRRAAKQYTYARDRSEASNMATPRGRSSQGDTLHANPLY